MLTAVTPLGMVSVQAGQWCFVWLHIIFVDVVVVGGGVFFGFFSPSPPPPFFFNDSFGTVQMRNWQKAIGQIYSSRRNDDD